MIMGLYSKRSMNASARLVTVMQNFDDEYFDHEKIGAKRDPIR